MESKLKGYLGIAQKAGYVVYGGDELKGYTKKLFVILHSETASQNLKDLLDKAAERLQIPNLEVKNLTELLSKDSCKAVGIKNNGIAQEIIKIVKG